MDLDRAKKRYSAIRKGKNAHLKAAHGKFYKKLLVSKSKAHNEKVSNELRTLNTSNPQKYWATLKKATKSITDCPISPADFETHFKNLNETEQLTKAQENLIQLSSNSEISANEDRNAEPNPQNDFLDELNTPITLLELKKGLKQLKNNKASGTDGVLNEMIKATFETMQNFYLQLFNFIFDSGNFPETWAEGLIVPIYKKREVKGIQITTVA